MNEERLRRALRAEPVPDPAGAEERGWRVARAAYDAEAVPARRPRGRRRALELLLAAALLAAMISPAGAAVRDWVGEALRGRESPSRPALSSLPGGGSLLVDSASGPWLVRQDGSKRLLGPYRESTWSPHGLFAAVTTPHQLLAVDPGGGVRWSLARRGLVRDPAWSSDGYRIAYLDGRRLRVVAGDGSGDEVLARGVRPVSPAWAPGPGHRLSFVAADGLLHTVDTDRGLTLSVFAAPAGTTALAWSGDGRRLLLLAPSELQLRNRAGRVLWRARAPGSTRFGAAALGPGGTVAATLDTRGGSSSQLLRYDSAGHARRLFAGLGRLGEVAYSPSGRWLLVAWRSADQFLFLSPGRPRRIVAISDIAAQFNPGTTAPSAFPRIAGWCCPPGPTAR